MAMYTNKLIPPPETLSSTLGESRNAKRGAVSMHLLDEIADMGGFKDKYENHLLISSTDHMFSGNGRWIFRIAW